MREYLTNAEFTLSGQPLEEYLTVIQKYFEGASVQTKFNIDRWEDREYPTFDQGLQWRVKPEEIPLTKEQHLQNRIRQKALREKGKSFKGVVYFGVNLLVPAEVNYLSVSRIQNKEYIVGTKLYPNRFFTSTVSEECKDSICLFTYRVNFDLTPEEISASVQEV